MRRPEVSLGRGSAGALGRWHGLCGTSGQRMRPTFFLLHLLFLEYRPHVSVSDFHSFPFVCYGNITMQLRILPFYAVFKGEKGVLPKI